MEGGASCHQTEGYRDKSMKRNHGENDVVRPILVNWETVRVAARRISVSTRFKACIALCLVPT